MVVTTYQGIRVFEDLREADPVRSRMQVENHHRQLIAQGMHFRDGSCSLFICIPAYGLTVRFKNKEDMLEHMAELGFRCGRIDYKPTWVRYERYLNLFPGF
jgi:hypothetical protein